MDKAVKEEINSIIAKHHFVMFEFTDGCAYWLYEHHRYLDPEDSKKVLLGKCKMPDIPDLRDSNRKRNSKIIYLTHPI